MQYAINFVLSAPLHRTINRPPMRAGRVGLSDNDQVGMALQPIALLGMSSLEVGFAWAGVVIHNQNTKVWKVFPKRVQRNRHPVQRLEGRDDRHDGLLRQDIHRAITWLCFPKVLRAGLDSGPPFGEQENVAQPVQAPVALVLRPTQGGLSAFPVH